MDDGERLIQQAAMVKAINPSTHVWVYRASCALVASHPASQAPASSLLLRCIIHALAVWVGRHAQVTSSRR